ncbi:MAG: hypothetical protein ACOYNV_20330 [Propionivibrio sp.]
MTSLNDRFSASKFTSTLPRLGYEPVFSDDHGWVKAQSIEVAGGYNI